MEKRELALKMSNILRYVTVGLMVLVFASWALPAFTYSNVTEKEVQDTISLWGFIGFTKNYPQMQALLGIKFVKLATINVTIVMLATGVLGILAGVFKKGLGTAILPLIFSGYGLIGYFTSDFLGMINHSSTYIIHIVLTALTLVAVLISLYFYIIEITTRPADYYLPKLGM
jgi:hypothetical protein